jgi:hypothetical protein
MKPEAGSIKEPTEKLRPATIANATPRAAPPEIPRVDGSTRGLRYIP